MTLIDLPAGLDLGALRTLAAGPKLSCEQVLPDGNVPAISYLRVSTKDQATRNGLEEGLSIPAQREAAQRKADQLNAVIVAEFIEPGESGKTARRKALQEMLDYLAEHPVRYCIINKVDRIARNRLDDAIIHATLRQAGVTLVSVMENIDETPSGMLMHGIMASIAEFYSLNLAQEVTKGLVQKATIGGTPHRAPIGYLNIRTTDANGHEVREVRLDPDRCELIRFAFTAYATGDWSLSKLARELETRGLTTRPTPSFPAKPVTTTALHKILTNPYYQGIVTFRDVTYPGTHDPLVTPETFEQVQTILQQNHVVGDKPQKYDHYLKGSIYCGCGKRLMFERPRNHQGVAYDSSPAPAAGSSATTASAPPSSPTASSSPSRPATRTSPSALARQRRSRACSGRCSTPSPNPPAMRRSSSPGRRPSSKPNRSSSSKPTTPTRSRSTCSRPSKTASARACKRSPVGSTRWRRPTTRPRSGSTRSSGSSPTSATSTPRPNPPSGGCSTGHCSTASPSMTRTKPPSNQARPSR
ncbi:hypothetical protein CGLAUT_10095 [Corynebacterium glaucum]|uniref:recombinase family protein n=1 Tax=Corynebacterium glaucum TaxID=187491 RepID=UPI0025B5A300|nr:recombinase family protein [Corynebacterium glaucum]WJZ08488.1 hypothetical protein CGLAUT_10095 [Corynebacterium glaucum]